MTIIRAAAVEEIRPLRARVLRDGDEAAASWPGDDESLHLAAVADTGEILGCLSLRPEECPDRPGVPAWRLRGMAVAGDQRGRGVGSGLLARADAETLAAEITLLWCNARTCATGFYRTAGWRLIGEEFLTETGIPHLRALRELA